MTAADRLRIARGARDRWNEEAERRRHIGQEVYRFGTRQQACYEVWGLALALWWWEELTAHVMTLEASL